ncbi:MAG: S8 family serine peptidase [Marinilabiliaceae bacterium]|nr:S8 family serine peptidase [Marinilabiliaceae bacterium]
MGSISSFAFGQADGYFISFTDKNNTPYTISNPEAFLSERAIERRSKQNIAINEQDLPVAPAYIDSLKKLGIQVKHTTKWLNGAIVFSDNANLMDTLDRVSFIKYVEKTKSSTTRKAIHNKFESTSPAKTKSSELSYGESWDQVRTVKGQLLHQEGYRGSGMHIAVIDAGFYDADVLPAFQHLYENDQILGTKDFVSPTTNIYQQHYHGMKVLAIIGGLINDEYVGTAPEASFWLLRSEDAATEFPIEADYWICAAEFADSAGVDVINTSLGYSQFDDASMNYSYQDLDGSSRISSAAQIAASKGIVIINSAGNEGNSPWYYVSTPGDAKDVLTIGAMAVDSTQANFSSFGPTSDGRTKPDITAMGVSVATQGTNGAIERGNGTSYSSPVITGLTACLWQALPDLTAAEIRDLIIKSGHQYAQPDNASGYGIPNFDIAYRTDVKETSVSGQQWKISPNPFRNQLRIQSLTDNKYQPVSVFLYDVLGQKQVERHFNPGEPLIIDNLEQLTAGMYILVIESQGTKNHFKLLKRNS